MRSFSNPDKGSDRERALHKSRYFSKEYFSLIQLASLSCQLNLIHKLNPKSVLEIGIGNGFVSSFLKRYGIEVTTCDINPNLEPDIICELQDLPRHVNKRFDLIVCCEVLEHMPWNDFSKNIQVLSEISDRQLISLPSGRWPLSLSGFLFIKKLIPISFAIDIPLLRKPCSRSHFWEVNYKSYCSLRNIEYKMSQYLNLVDSKRFALCPLQHYFITNSIK